MYVDKAEQLKTQTVVAKKDFSESQQNHVRYLSDNFYILPNKLFIINQNVQTKNLMEGSILKNISNLILD